MTNNEEIRSWLLEGKKLGASHVIIVCDTFDYGDYPVYVKKIPETMVESMVGRVYEIHDVRQYVDRNYRGQNMQKVMEVYNLSLPMEQQLAAALVYNY
jgi:hypothetical protein